MKEKIKLGSISKENFVKITVNPKVYSLQTIYAAGYVFLDRSYILLDQDEKKNIEVYLFPQKKRQDLKRLGFEFCNELLNYSHYFSRAKANAETVKTIMQRALFSASPSLAEEAEEKEIQDLIKELEEEEEKEKEKGKDELATSKKK